MSRWAEAVSSSDYGTQSGMVLLLCLIFLLALTLLGLTASLDTILQNKLASNLQDTERAKQSALLTLSWAEHWLLEHDGPAPETCSTPCDGLYVHATGDLPSNPESENYSWWLEHGYEAGINPLNGDRIATLSSDSINRPVWIIEAVQTIPPAENGTPDTQVWYRLLARGSGRTETAVSVIESTVVRYWPASESTGLSDSLTPGPCPESEPPVACGRFTWRELR